MGDTYRPDYSPGGYQGYPPRYPPANGYPSAHGFPPGIAPYPPLPPGPPPGLPSGPLPGFSPGLANQTMYHFGQNGPIHPPSQFGFHANNLPLYPTDVNLPPQPERYRPGHRYGNRSGDSGGGRRGGFRPREPRPRVPTAERPLLKFQRGNTPDQIVGMDDESGTIAQRFRNVDNMSDSDEENMVESDGEDINTDAAGVGGSNTQDVSQKEHTIPKWSNPELYTAAPPILDGSHKKKDVVKMIRKARVAAEKEASSQEPVSQNDDFISFGFEDEEKTTSELNMPPPNAPSGPRSLQLPSVQTLSQTHPTTKSQVPEASIAARLQDDRKRKRSPGESSLDSNDDLDIELPVRKHPKIIKKAAAGHIIDLWEADDHEDPCPWMKPGKHNFTENAGFRLHKEICDFHDYVKPRDFEHEVRQDLLRRTRKVIKVFNRRCEVECFGSFAADLYLPDADMDVVVLSQMFLDSSEPLMGQTRGQLERVARCLVREGLAHPASIDIVPKAKVPLVKFVDKSTGIRVDMSFENTTGIQANKTFRVWKDQFPAMPIIVTVIKQFLLMRGLNEVVNGGIGGFTVTCLVTSLLQHMPRVQSRQLIPEHHLGEILLEFLDLYGNLFDLSRTAIEMEPPRFVPKAKVQPTNWMNKMDRLYIIDPNNPQNDISGGSSNVTLVFEMFAEARAQILVAMRSPQGSMLGSLLGGKYSRYTIPRERFRRLHRKLDRADGHGEVSEALRWHGRQESNRYRENANNMSMYHRQPAQRDHGEASGALKTHDSREQSGHGEVFKPLKTRDRQEQHGLEEVSDLLNKHDHPGKAPEKAEKITKKADTARASSLRQRFPGQEFPASVTKSAATKLEGIAQARRLRELFPEFIGLVGADASGKKGRLFERALILKRAHPEINVTQEQCSKHYVQQLEQKYSSSKEEPGSESSDQPQPQKKRKNYNLRSSKATKLLPKQQ